MKTSFISLFLLFFLNISAQESQISLWNPYDMQFTRDNNYLVVSSPNDSKIWNLQTKDCINITPNFYKETTSNNNSWAYLQDDNSFFFHQTVLGDEIYKINPDGKSRTTLGSLNGGKYQGYTFDFPSTYFLTSDILLCIRSEASQIPYISVEKIGERKPLFTSKIDGYNSYDKSNMNFHVLKGDNNIYYLLSFRTSPKNSKNGEGIVTEINLDTKKAKILAKGIEAYIGDDSYSASRIEKLKRSTETPHFIILHLDDFVYVIRKSDGKILDNLDIRTQFSENAYPEICGERDGKLLVRNYDFSKDGGINFTTLDFDTKTKIEDVLHFTINVLDIKFLRTAVSHTGKEFVIACNMKGDDGFKVAYIDSQKLTMLRDNANLVENFLSEQAIAKQKNEAAKAQKTEELRTSTKEEAVARNWYAVIDKDNNRSGFGINLTADSYGNISGVFSYRYSPSGMDHYHWYDAIYEVSGKFISKDKFTLKVDSTKFSHEYFGDNSIFPAILTFQIVVNPETNTYRLYCEEWAGYFEEGYVDSHYF